VTAEAEGRFALPSATCRDRDHQAGSTKPFAGEAMGADEKAKRIIRFASALWHGDRGRLATSKLT